MIDFCKMNFALVRTAVAAISDVELLGVILIFGFFFSALASFHSAIVVAHLGATPRQRTGAKNTCGGVAMRFHGRLCYF